MEETVDYRVYNKLIDKLNTAEKVRLDDGKLLQIMINLSQEAADKAIELIDKHGLVGAMKESRLVENRVMWNLMR